MPYNYVWAILMTQKLSSYIFLMRKWRIKIWDHHTQIQRQLSMLLRSLKSFSKNCYNESIKTLSTLPSWIDLH